MELYQRIKQRRIELNMSQEELAFKLGYKSRSSINKIEMGDNDIPQSKILAFANALDTTPSYLLGLDVIYTDGENNHLIECQTIHDHHAFYKRMEQYKKLLTKLQLETLNDLNDSNITKVNKYAQNLLAIQQMEEPVLMAAHHDNPTEEQQEKIIKDMDILKRPNK